MTDSISAPHNHQRCVDRAMRQARQLCRDRKCRLTPIREQVLAVIWSSHQPIGAYAILERMAASDRRPPAPPTVYRALDFLMENQLVHRIASLNAFVGCNDPQTQHQGHFLICRGCQVAIEVCADGIDQAIATAAADCDFSVHSQCVEIIGYCQHCRAGGE